MWLQARIQLTLEQRTQLIMLQDSFHERLRRTRQQATRLPQHLLDFLQGLAVSDMFARSPSQGHAGSRWRSEHSSTACHDA